MPAARFCGRDFRDVERNGGAGEADADADDGAPDDQRDFRSGGGADDRAQDKNHGGECEVHSSADLIGQAAAGERGDGCSHQNDAYYQFLVKHGERKTLLDENQRSGDYSGIVAKEEPAESGERGGNVNEGGAFRLPGGGVGGCVRAYFLWGHLSSAKSGRAGEAAKNTDDHFSIFWRFEHFTVVCFL